MKVGLLYLITCGVADNMDILSHGLWAGAAAKAINSKKKEPLRVWLAILFGVFPDVFAFTVSFVYLGWLRLTGDALPFIIRPGEMEPPIRNQHPLLQLTHSLYNLSHSLFIFFIVFGLVAWYFRRPIWEMGGWLIHILIDIPSHSYAFFPTPFLWPLSDFRVNGIPWSTPAFFWTNIALLFGVYFLLWIFFRKKVGHK